MSQKKVVFICTSADKLSDGSATGAWCGASGGGARGRAHVGFGIARLLPFINRSTG
jgi:hypothetical protein